MKYENEEYRTRKASALKAANNLLSVIEWRIVDEPVLLPPVLQEGLNAPDAGLVLVPAAGYSGRELEAAVRKTRATLLIIEPGSTTNGRPSFYFTLVRPVAGEIRWTRALRLWVNWDRTPFLVPDADGPDPEGPCFALKALGVSEVPRPYAHAYIYNFGVEHADAILLEQ